MQETRDWGVGVGEDGGRGSTGWRGQIQTGSQREGNGARRTGGPASFRGLSPNHRPRNSGKSEPSPAARLAPCSHSLAPTDPRPGGHTSCPPPLRTQSAVPTFPHRCPHRSSSLAHRCLFALMGEQGWGAVLGETSQSQTLPPGDLSPHPTPRPLPAAEGSDNGPPETRGMGALMSRAPSRPQLSGSCPLPSRFQTFRPGAPPPPGAAAAVPPSLPPSRSAGRSSRGLGVMGRRACAPAARGLQLPPSGLSLPRGGRMWAPRGRPEPSGPGTSPGRGPAGAPRSRAGRARSGGALQAGPAGRAEPEPSPSPGGWRWVPRAGRGGRGGGRQPRTHQRRGCASRGRGPQSGGLMAGRGAGAPASHPPSRRRLQSD